MVGSESKAEKFERIAERRVNETLRALRLLGNLADRRNYDYSDDQVSTLLSAIDQEVRTLRSRFKAEAGVGLQRFSFRKS